MKNIVTTFIGIILFSSLAYSQKDSKWVDFTTAKGDFSFSVPSDYVIAKVQRGWTIVSDQAEFSIQVEKLEMDNPRGYVKDLYFFKADDHKNNKEFSIGDFLIRTVNVDKENFRSFNVYAGSKRNYYFITVKILSGKDDSATTLKSSLRFDGKSIIDNSADTKNADGKSLVVDNLKSSPIVENALSKKCSREISYRYESTKSDENSKDSDDKSNRPRYSRWAVILDVPRIESPSSGPGNGTVRLRVLLGSNGCVSGAIVVKTPSKEAASNAVRAVSQIKFLPAVIDGKPADSFKIFEYQYSSR